MTLVGVVESPLYLAGAESLMSEAEREHVIDLIAADLTAEDRKRLVAVGTRLKAQFGGEE